MHSDGGSWAPFGPGSDDEPEPDEPPPSPLPTPVPAPVEEPVEEPPAPVEEPPPAASFAPPAPPVVPPLPTPSQPTAPQPPPLAWPDPQPRPDPPPAEQQAPWPPQGYQTAKPVPSDATVALVLGIASFLFCGFVGPFAIHYGLKARRQIDADPKWGGRGMATWGYVLGIISTTLLVLLLVLFAAGVIALST